MRSAISSPVAPARVWKRQCSARSPSRNPPRCVFVFPMSIASSTAGIIAGIGCAPWTRPSCDPRLAPVADGGRDARPQGHRLQARRPDAGGIEGRAPCGRVPRHHGARAEDRRSASPGLARDRPGARPARPGAGALSVRSRSPDGGRAGGAVGRRVAAVGRPARPVERAAARSLTARLLLRGREAGDPDRPRRKDRGTDRGAVGPLQRRHRRERPRRPRRASGDAAANRRLDRRRRARRPRAQRGRSADRHQPAPADDLQDLRPAIASRPAGELAMRVDPDYPGDAPPILPPAWLAGLRAEQAAPAR